MLFRNRSMLEKNPLKEDTDYAQKQLDALKSSVAFIEFDTQGNILSANDLFPWQQLEAQIEPFYPKAGKGRRPYPLATMLRIHFMQNWYNMSDPAMEDALYEITSMRLFADLSLEGSIPDHTTIMNFRHLLERLIGTL